MSKRRFGVVPPGGTHRRSSPTIVVSGGDRGRHAAQSRRGPGARRNWKGSLSRPATTYQHCPVESASRMRPKAATTSATSRIGKPMSRSVCSEPLMMLVEANDGHKRVDADAVGLVDLAERTHQADDRVLVGRIDGVERSGHQAGHGRGGHDRPATARLHGAASGCNAVDDAVEVDGHRAPVGLGVEVVTHAAPRRDAGVEVGDMQSAERLDRERDGGRAGGGIRDVGPDEPTLELVGDRLSPGDVDVGDHDVGPTAGQVPGDALADAVAPAGDEARPCRRRRVPCARS